MASRNSGAPTGKFEAYPEPRARENDLSRIGARLVVKRPGVPEVEIGIDKTEFFIGRQASAVDLVVDDEWVSRKHARLSMNEHGYVLLEDLGSQNGILFQDRPVRRLNLRQGDEFMIGRTGFVFFAEIFDVPGAAEVPAPPREVSDFREPPAVTPGPPPEENDEDAPG